MYPSARPHLSSPLGARASRLPLLLAALLLAAAVGLGGCAEAPNEAHVAYRLIEDNQSRCRVLTQRIGRVGRLQRPAYLSSLPREEDPQENREDEAQRQVEQQIHHLIEDSLAVEVASIEAGRAQVRRQMALVPLDHEAGDTLDALATVHEDLCDMATRPLDYPFDSYSIWASALVREYGEIRRTSRFRFGNPSKSTRRTIAALEAEILEAEKTAVEGIRRRNDAERDREVAELRERRRKERIAEDVMREARARRQQAEEEVADVRRRRRAAENASEARRRRLAADQGGRSGMDRPRATAGGAAPAAPPSMGRTTEKARRIEAEMRAWHRDYTRLMGPIRTAVSEVRQAWSEPLGKPEPQCAHLVATLDGTDLERLRRSPDPTLNRRLEMVLKGFGRAGRLCTEGARFAAEGEMRRAIEEWGAAGQILRRYSLEP